MERDFLFISAERRIDVALENDSKSIEFCHLYLTVLPKTISSLTKVQELDLEGNRLLSLPKSISNLVNLKSLSLRNNQLRELPEAILGLTSLESLDLRNNQLRELPEAISGLTNLKSLDLCNNQLTALPETISSLTNLKTLELRNNRLTSLPESISCLANLYRLGYEGNPLSPELLAAANDGVNALLDYLRARLKSGSVESYEAKMILVGEGDVGKSCLLDALCNRPWKEHESTHGIRIETVKVAHPNGECELQLNGWDFGGQRVYRPTHQLFFSESAIYLVVWKPREGSQAGQVAEWIRLIKNRQPDAKVFVVATHGGPMERQPDIDQHELINEFTKDTILGFFHVDNRPAMQDKKTGVWSGERRNITQLLKAIAQAASDLPGMGEKVPRAWPDVRMKLVKSRESWMSYDDFSAFCTENGIKPGEIELFARLTHQLGHLIHFAGDPTLKNFVILRPDWLATAISLVFDDEVSRRNKGLVEIERLSELWNDPERRRNEERYPRRLHPAFIGLMKRFDISYEVTRSAKDEPRAILVGQLVSDIRPETLPDWGDHPSNGDCEQTQICRIVDMKQKSSVAEGLFYQLIVRLHKYSFGRENFDESVHWQRGLMLEDHYNGRALLEHIGNDVRITVRAAYPSGFLAMLTAEVKWVVEYFWEGLRCEVTVPCDNPCDQTPGSALFEVAKLITFKKKGLDQYPCHISGCDQLKDIDGLLVNATTPENDAMGILQENLDDIKENVLAIREETALRHVDSMSRFDNLDASTRTAIAKVEAAYTGLIKTLLDEARDGPRLFSFEAVNPGFFDRPNWIAEKFFLTLWCEHSRLPLPAINGKDDKTGVYEIQLTRKWLSKAAPFLKGFFTTLSLVLPVASTGAKLLTDADHYNRIKDELDFSQKCAESVLKGGEKVLKWADVGGEYKSASSTGEKHESGVRRVEGSALRELHAFLQEKDPGFGGLTRVQNRRHEFLWVHPKFASEY